MIATLLALLVAIGLALTPAWASHDGQEDICHNAAVIFCDNFEARATGSGDLARAIFKNAGWSSITPTTEVVVISSSQRPQGVFNGTKAFEFVYPATSSGDNGGTGNATTLWQGGGSHRTLYYRWYVKHSANWLFSPIATKHLETMNESGETRMFLMHGPAPPSVVMEPSSEFVHFAYTSSPPNTTWSQNINGVVAIQRNQWYCLEVRVTMNSGSSTADGYIQGWIGDVQHWEYPNDIPDTGPGRNLGGLFLGGYWNCLNSNCATPGNNHPTMQRWHDNFVVSTQRIGCLGAGPLPNAPTNLRIVEWLKMTLQLVLFSMFWR